MRISDLSQPILAAKSDWLVATDWIGFSPRNGTGASREQCRATIARQCNGGYVIEYITKGFGKPNPGFETDETYLAERSAHADVAGRLIAVHKLKPAAMPLREILGDHDFERLQDMWAVGQNRHRWSVAFPIVESFEIDGRPTASEVLGEDAVQRLFAHPSATLRPLNDTERARVGELSISPRAVRHQWISVEEEFLKAALSDLPKRLLADIQRDISGAFEGLAEEDLTKRRRRAAWLAHRFAMERARSSTLHCDDCGFDPAGVIDELAIKPRSLLDVHHKYPLCEGERFSTIEDFELLCPTCHRLEHARLRLGASRHHVSHAADEEGADAGS